MTDWSRLIADSSDKKQAVDFIRKNLWSKRYRYVMFSAAMEYNDSGYDGTAMLHFFNEDGSLHSTMGEGEWYYDYIVPLLKLFGYNLRQDNYYKRDFFPDNWDQTINYHPMVMVDLQSPTQDLYVKEG